MKKILLILSILLSSALSMAQSTGSLPYWTLMPSRDTLVSGDSLIFHYETTGKYVKIAWNDFKSLITPDSVDLSNYIKRDGTSAETTGSINIGDGFGFRDTSSLYNSRSVIAGLDFFKSDPFYSGSRPLRMHAGSTDYRTTFSLADNGWISNCTDNFGNNSYSYSNSLTSFYTSQSNGSGSGYMSFNNQGLKINAASSVVTRSGLIRTSLYTGSGTHTYELPNKGGTFAMTSDIIGSTYSFGSIVVSSNIIALNDSLYTLVSNATFTDPAPVEGKGFTVFVRNGTATIGGTTYSVAGTVVRRVFHSGAWANYSNVPISGTSGVSYNSSTGAISFNLGTSNTWTAQQTATSWVANGTGGAGYLQLASQSSTPAAVNGSMILYSDASNRFSIVRRNNANSADITRTHVYPDGSFSYNFPTPLSGTSNDLAALNTVQTWPAQQSFSSLTNRAGGILPTTTGTGNCGSFGAFWLNVCGINSYTTNILTQDASGGSSTTITKKTGDVTGTTNATFSGNLISLTGNITNASALSTQFSGSHILDVGTVLGSAKRGNWQLYGGTTLVNFQGGERIMYIGNRTAAPTANGSAGTFIYAESQNLNTTGSIVFPLAGTGLQFKTGTNARVGTTTLTAGTITVANTSVTANTKVKVQLVSVNGGTLGVNYTYTVNAGVGFTITAVSAVGTTVTTDTAILDWYLTEFN